MTKCCMCQSCNLAIHRFICFILSFFLNSVMRRILLLLCVCCWNMSVRAGDNPVVMKIDGKEVLRSDFEQAYRHYVKTTDSVCSPENYVESFVFRRLQIEAAKEAQMDTAQEFLRQREELKKKLLKEHLLGMQMPDSCRKNVWGENEMVKIRQIFKFLPQRLTNIRLQREEYRMDSIYRQLKNGQEGCFDVWVNSYSDDTLSRWVTSSQITAEMETEIAGLAKGEISRPFFTPEGLHIVKVVERKKEDKQPDYITAAQMRNIVQQLKTELHYVDNPTGMEELMLEGRTSKALFSIADREYTGEMFVRFAASCPFSIQRQLELFINKSLFDYVDEYMEQRYPAVARILQAYDEDYLLAGIRRLKVEIPSMNDRVGWATYFRFHQSDYRWEHPKYKGIVVRCIDKKTVKEVKRLLKKTPEKEWKNTLLRTLNADENRIAVEQGIFAEGDNKYVDEQIFKKRKNSEGLSYPFIVVKGRKKRKPDDYREVLHQVQKDYRNYLEICWKRELMETVKVEINEEVLKSVNNN